MSRKRNSGWWPSNEKMTKTNHLKMTLTNKKYADTHWSNKIAIFLWSSTVSWYWRITFKTWQAFRCVILIKEPFLFCGQEPFLVKCPIKHAQKPAHLPGNTVCDHILT